MSKDGPRIGKVIRLVPKPQTVARYQVDRSSQGIPNRALKNRTGELFHDRDPVAKFPREISKKECIASLNVIGPVSDRLADLLNIPEKLYMISDGPSFSSDKLNGAGIVTKHIVFGSALDQGSLPDFGLHISEKGSSVFCTLVDRKRKIIVHASISSMFSKTGQADWGQFEFSLDAALSAAKSNEEKGKAFSFVMRRESLSQLLP